MTIVGGARRLTIVGLAIGMLAGASLGGDPPRKYDLGVETRWRAGETVTETESGKVETTLSFTRRDGTPVNQAQSRSEESVVVWRCLDADSKGKRLRAHAFVRRRLERNGPDEDRSATGAFVEVTTEKWTLLSSEVKPSAKGREWLEKHFGPESEQRRAVFKALAAPPSLAVGESWNAPESAMRALTSGENAHANLDVSKVDCKVTLVAAEEATDGSRITCAIKMGGPIAGSLGTTKGQQLPLGEGSSLKFDGEAVGTLGRHDTRLSGSVEMKMKLDMRGVAIEAKAEGRMDRTRVIGGEMPDPPKAAAPAAPAGGAGTK